MLVPLLLRREEEAVQGFEKAGDHMPHTLDPLMEMLARFSSPSDLLDTIRAVYARLDADNNGTVSFQEMREGLAKLIPGMYLSQEDWEGMVLESITTNTPAPFETGSGSDTDMQYEMPEEAFEQMMMYQLRHHLFRKLNLGFQTTLGHSDSSVMVCSLHLHLLPAPTDACASHFHATHASQQTATYFLIMGSLC